MNYVANLTRSEGDPKVLQSGPSSLTSADSLARALGWFSLGLGLVELFAPRQVTHFLGMPGKEPLVRAYGVREIGAGIMSLSVDKDVGLWSRVAGDGVDVLTLLSGFNNRNPKKGNVGTALALVIGITFLDMVAAKAVAAVHNRNEGTRRDYSGRSGFPHGVDSARAVARDRFSTRSTPREQPSAAA